MPADSLPTRLRSLREKALLTQAELAQRSGLSREYVARLETGRHARPSLAAVGALARGLGVPLEKILKNLQESP